MIIIGNIVLNGAILVFTHVQAHPVTRSVVVVDKGLIQSALNHHVR